MQNKKYVHLIQTPQNFLTTEFLYGDTSKPIIFSKKPQTFLHSNPNTQTAAIDKLNSVIYIAALKHNKIPYNVRF